jgi:hypothetical protein
MIDSESGGVAALLVERVHEHGSHQFTLRLLGQQRLGRRNRFAWPSRRNQQ